MKTFRHSLPIDPQDLAIARNAVQQWLCATGGEKTQIYRSEINAIRFYEWVLRIHPAEESALSTNKIEASNPANNPPAARSAVPAIKRDSGTSRPKTGTHTKRAGERVIVEYLGSAPKPHDETAILSAMTAARTDLKSSRMNAGILFEGQIRTPLEMRKLTGSSHLKAWTGSRFVRF